MNENTKTQIEQIIQATDLPWTIHQFAWLDPCDVPFCAEVRDMCKSNRCGLYGKTWTCPPGVGNWETLRDECRSYAHALVFTTKHILDDDFDFEGITDAGKRHKQADLALAERLKEAGIPHHLYSAGGCTLCKTCTYPDAPCRFPERVHRSMEACGIDVGALARACNLRYNNGPQTVTYFSMIVFA